MHTTEFNYMDRKEAPETCGTVLFRRLHFEQLSEKLTARGYAICPLDFDVGDQPMDHFIDLPPFATGSSHLKLSLHGIPSTCFGITIIAP